MSNKRKIHFAIIGCGVIASWHYNAIQAIEDAEVDAVFDVNKAARENFASDKGLKTYDDLDKMLAEPSIDAVCICTPSGLHSALAVKVANARKHIIVEKPMAITHSQIDDILTACIRNNVKLCSISQLRFSRAIIATRAAIKAGMLGRLVCGDIYMKFYRNPEYFSSSTWRGTKAMDGGGALMNQGIHGVDLLQYLMGPITSVFAKSSTLVHKIEVEDTLSSVVQYANGALGVIQATTSVYPGYSRRIEINGSRGSIILNENSIEKWDVPDYPMPSGLECGTTSSAASSNTAFELDGHIAQISDMVHAIQDDRVPLVNQYEGRKPIDIILAIYESAKEGKEVPLPVYESSYC